MSNITFNRQTMRLMQLGTIYKESEEMGIYGVTKTKCHAINLFDSNLIGDQ